MSAAEADFEADALDDGPALEDVDFDFDQAQLPSRYGRKLLLTAFNTRLHRGRVQTIRTAQLLISQKSS